MNKQLIGLATLAVAAAAVAPASASVRFAPGPQMATRAIGQASQAEPSSATRKLLYAADALESVVYVYSLAGNVKSPAPLYEISNGIAAPQGLTTDKNGNLYVANLQNNTVTVYAPGARTPMFTIPNLDTPTDVKVDSSGDVFVSDAPGFGSQSNVVEFAPGGTSPIAVWYTTGGNWTIIGIALVNPTIPSEASVYASTYIENGSGGYSGFVLNCVQGDPSRTCNPVGSPPMGHTVGIAVVQSPAGGKPFKYAIVDQYVPGIDLFTNGNLTKQIVTGGTPNYIALNATKTDIFVSQDFDNGYVEELSWPAGKVVNKFIPPGGGQDSIITGLAVTPAGTYF
jgi:hypothetical protein